MPNPRAWITVVAAHAVLSSACVSSGVTGAPPGAPTPPALQAAMRVHHSKTNRTVSFGDMVAAAARADIVFFGEQHDDPETHFAEFALLEGIARIRPLVVVSLEMFERDVQPLLDAYLAGRMSEADFLAGSRPWERYATDYRPLVLLARSRGWSVVAANVPRAIANAVSRRGLTALDTLPASSRAFAARELSCPHDAYFDRFAQEMKGHGGGGPGSAPSAAEARLMTERFYAAQCAKDETMGESIAQALRVAGPGAIVVHFNGAFHSDYGHGTAARARRRAPGATSVVITAVPVAAPDNAGPAVSEAKAEFVLFTRKPRA